MNIRNLPKMVSLAVAVGIALAGCRRTDVRDFSVSVPAMTEEDVPAIVSALGAYGGINPASVKFDFKTRTVRMKYDSMQLAKKNIEMAIAKAGLEANGVTPESVGAEKKKR